MDPVRPLDLLNRTGHRPWPLPAGRWNFHQAWCDALFLHYRVDPEKLRKLVPKELELDLHDGSAWISAVAFTMRSVRPRWLPAWPPVSDFHELNLRTYVRGTALMPGVHFLAIDAGNWASVYLARVLSVLPYRKANIRRTLGPGQRFKCHSPVGLHLDTVFAPGAAIAAPAQVDRWLTERYALYQRHGRSTWRYQVHHAPWPLNTVQIDDLRFVPGNGFPPSLSPGPDLAHWSDGVQVLSWKRELVTGPR